MPVIRDVFTDVLLALAAGTVAFSAIGVMIMPDAYARLHYVTPAAVVAPVLVTLAVFVREGLDSNTGMTVIMAVFMVAAAPFLSHATIRAIRAREDGVSEDSVSGEGVSGDSVSGEGVSGDSALERER